MKIIHTGDWHLGKIVHGVSMLTEQRHLLNQIQDILRAERPELLIIAGDLYDRAIPPVEAVQLLDRFLETVCMELQIPMAIISGNHDSSGRIGFGSRLMASSGLTVGRLEGKAISVLELQDGDCPCQVWMLPYEDPMDARDALELPIRTHEEAMIARIETILPQMKSGYKQILVAHQFFVGSSEPELSESERPLSMGGTDAIGAGCLKAFDYVALGHLHRPQWVVPGNVRYAGSLMRYSFSEINHDKSLTVLEYENSGFQMRTIPLNPPRTLRKIQGPLEMLLTPLVSGMGNAEDYLLASLTDEGALHDPAGRLRQVYPNLLRIERANTPEGSSVNLETEKLQTQSPIEVSGQFFEAMMQKPLSEVQQGIIVDILSGILRNEREGNQ